MTIKILWDIPDDFLSGFQHDQIIRRKYVQSDGAWKVIPADEHRAWSPEKRLWIPQYLREQSKNGGTIAAAYEKTSGELLGFASVDGVLRGTNARYANLTMLFVDDRFQRQGIGARLFRELCSRAVAMGAEKLFISAISSEETVAFYFAMGCTNAVERIEEFVDTTEDRYLEKSLRKSETCVRNCTNFL